MSLSSLSFKKLMSMQNLISGHVSSLCTSGLFHDSSQAQHMSRLAMQLFHRLASSSTGLFQTYASIEVGSVTSKGFSHQAI